MCQFQQLKSPSEGQICQSRIEPPVCHCSLSAEPGHVSSRGTGEQGDGSTALPHVSVPNISYVDWTALKRAGFEGAVFDKDNTLTEPYAIAIAPILVDSLRKCIQTFNGKVVLLSNSAGLEEFDPDGAPLCSYQVADIASPCNPRAL